ncbi:MAG: winged helix-turn-helix transcriptional regulator [Microcoleaceae cyanobacterium]
MQAPNSKSEKSGCPAESTISLLRGRWKLLILRELFQGVRRFNQLQRSLPGITQKVLTQQLRELEVDQLLNRKVYPEIPPKVEYSLTPLGESLESIVQQMHEWSVEHL